MDKELWERGKLYKEHQIQVHEYYLRYAKDTLELSDKSTSVRYYTKRLNYWENKNLEDCALLAEKFNFYPNEHKPKPVIKTDADNASEPDSTSVNDNTPDVGNISESDNTPDTSQSEVSTPKQSKPKQSKPKQSKPKKKSRKQKQISILDLL